MDNREKILMCAEELFYAKGYDAAGVQEIAEKAGITKPTLYYYFGSKRGLLETLLETKFRVLRERIQGVAASDGDIRNRLHSLAEVYYRSFMEETKFYMFFMALFYSARENEAYQTVRPYLQELYGMVVQIFENASWELGNMHGRQRQFAISFIGVVHQYLSLNYEAGAEAVSEEQVYALVEQFMHGIFS